MHKFLFTLIFCCIAFSAKPQSDFSSSAVADALVGDWMRIRAEYVDGSSVPDNHAAKKYWRYCFFIDDKGQMMLGDEGNSSNYSVDGNILKIGSPGSLTKSFSIESLYDKELRLLEMKKANPVRYILIPTDSFTLTMASTYRYTIDNENADTVYASSPGIEPVFKEGRLYRYVLEGFTMNRFSFTFTLVVLKDGTIGEVNILKSSNEELNEQFIKKIKSTSGKWIAGAINGKPINVKYETSMGRLGIR